MAQAPGRSISGPIRARPQRHRRRQRRGERRGACSLATPGAPAALAAGGHNRSRRGDHPARRACGDGNADRPPRGEPRETGLRRAGRKRRPSTLRPPPRCAAASAIAHGGARGARARVWARQRLPARKHNSSSPSAPHVSGSASASGASSFQVLPVSGKNRRELQLKGVLNPCVAPSLGAVTRSSTTLTSASCHSLGSPRSRPTASSGRISGTKTPAPTGARSC